MFKRLSQSLYERSISSAYTQRFKRKGASAEGVFWASEITQIARFEHALIRLGTIFGKNSYQLADIGCGYGAHYMHLCVLRLVIILLIISGLISMPA